MLAIIWVQNRLFSTLLSKKCKDLQNYNFACCFFMGVKLGL